MSDGRAWFSLPTGRKLESPDQPENYAGSVNVLQKATPERVALARRYWTEAKRDDFEIDGRGWRDRATGMHFRVATYDPLANVDPKASNISTFVVSDGLLVPLYRVGAEDASAKSVYLGEVGARVVTGREPLGVTVPEIF